MTVRDVIAALTECNHDSPVGTPAATTMPTDATMQMEYSLVLTQLRTRLADLDGRRQAVAASIAAISRLADVEQAGLPMPNAHFTPVVPPHFFDGTSPTEAYRLLREHWPGSYTPPQIADIFTQGGMAAPTRTRLLQAIHSVLKRERARVAAVDVGR